MSGGCENIGAGVEVVYLVHIMNDSHKSMLDGENEL